MSLISTCKKLIAGAALAAASLLAVADEPQLLLEEVTVIGAVRASDAVSVDNIDVAGDEQLVEMPVAYE
ncbi:MULTISPECIES: hypothetical protein [Spongiibacter]|jgi:hypothetical protein|uniref:hypothetical protein n=1 Tax=Spongiibacter TaxID=630749 RepID=UPI000C4AAF9E|nr:MULTISPECIES: hypothetical protein [Spongiibacter]MAY37341.1 hypothetical protein [Spongiibacter sp.]MBI58153.1 hypothetical protein [Spongiibacter sp.]MBU71479.1 hypothetical protein [Spongiibacter sp.]|tara:strand:+ start:1646 stop:1852 length:207 start_codon:yes stop_codon:yes gene_type:complete